MLSETKCNPTVKTGSTMLTDVLHCLIQLFGQKLKQIDSEIISFGKLTAFGKMT
jgi:hypothetical protein